MVPVGFYTLYVISGALQRLPLGLYRLTCREDWFNGEKDDNEKWIKEAVHFDINHLNTIVWKTPEELKERLIKRIKATI